MKIFIFENGITLTGKAWEIRAKLKEYSKKYHYLADWLSSVNINQ